VTESLGKLVPTNRAWKRSDLDVNRGWEVSFSQLELAQLEKAAKSLPADTSQWTDIDREGIDAPDLDKRIALMRAEIGDGLGFSKISGFDSSRYDQDMLHRIYWVIAVMLGNVVAQNAKGELIGYVEDLIGGRARGNDDRGYTSSDELRFHCDGGGVSALFCVRQAPEGGENAIVSLFSVYNELLNNYPEHLEVLHRGFPLYLRKESGDGKEKGAVTDFRIPTFSETEGRMTAWLNLKLAELASEVADSDYTARELAALKCIEEIAERDDMKFSFRLNPGELVIINNFALMHKRSAFKDSDDVSKKRLMMRLWLNLYDAPQPVRAVSAVGVGFPGVKPVIRAVAQTTRDQ